MNTRWSKPVIVSIGEPPVPVTIETAQAASWALIEDWPLEDGDALDKALMVFAAVDAGKRKPEEARAAFVEAAKEAGVLLQA